jgi:nucleoside 2-deoxyribosyltransferase
MVYVAGPYRAETWDQVMANVARASGVTAALLRDGHSVICPHAMTHTFEMYHLPDEVFLRNGLDQLRRCDAVCLVTGGPNWRSSSGTVAEVEEARRLGMGVYLSPDHLAQGDALLWGAVIAQ